MALVAYDGGGTLVDANEAACALLGEARESLVGTSAEAADWLVTDAGDAPMTVHPAVAALKSRRAVRGALVRVRRPDGSDVWLQVDAVPRQVDNGTAAIVLASLTDVTHLIARSGMSARTPGDHIVDAVTAALAETRLEPQAVLTAVTRALSKLRPAIWVAGVIGKDPNAPRVIASDENDPEIAAYVESMQLSGAVTTTPITTRVIETGEPLLLPNVSIEGLQSLLNDEIRSYMGVHPTPWPERMSVLVVPMHARGAIIGTLGLFERSGSNPLNEKDVIWVQAIADRTGLAFENAQLYEDAVRRLDRLTALQAVSLTISASPDLRLTLKVILDHITARLRVDAADVMLLDESDNTLVLAASTGFLATAAPDIRLPADEGIPGRAMQGRRIETVTALSAFSQFRRRSTFAREGFKAYGAVPLVSRGRLLGALEVFHRSELKPDQEWLSFLDALGSVAAVAIDSSSMQERLRLSRDPVAAQRRHAPLPRMTSTEAEIFRLAAAGLTNGEIAGQVHLSRNTVKFHMRKILQKTGVGNRTELASVAAKEGWL